ncbi:MAG: hypothetical protein ACREOL_07145, partial [Candidatus Dormibacteria bacterium]
SARPTEPSPRWPTEPALTPASVRAQSLPQDDDRLAALSSEPTQLIPMEPYRLEPKFRRRGGFVILWLLVVAAVVVVTLLLTGRI